VCRLAFVLTVYFKEAIKEIFLPGVNNRTVHEILEKEVSGFDFDINLTLDVFENEWRIKTNSDVRFESDTILIEDGLKINATIVKNHAPIVILVGMMWYNNSRHMEPNLL